ncbi:ABC transporter substrate-binding protein [Marinobacterium sp. D7]|uniref:ABC transporter substrate-binding protein n=1 Tax=Marinobacterium ramblicola TaxID=2849041 RepID=UPI001C2DAC88|nr:ABC transporter substrate-binding protein [Marinobacterium ramblicola]MBV1786890.1 ABC transporter substrate-binding protein [Marinobacterium ramblicola]
MAIPSLYRMLLLVTLALSMLGCNDSPHPPLKIGTNVWPGYEPLYLSRELGYLDRKQGQLVELLSASEVIRAYRNGALDVAALTLDELLLLREGGIAAQVLLITDTSYGADAIIAREARTVAELKGQRIGVETNALGAYMLSRALNRAGLTSSDVEIVSLEANQHEEAFLRGSVDAVVTFEPMRSRLLESGGVEVFNSRRIPDEVIDLLVVRPEIVENRPEQLAQLLDVWFRSVDYLTTQPAKAHALMSTRLRLTPEQVSQALTDIRIPDRQRNQLMIYKEPSMLLQQAKRMYEVMNTRHLISRPVDLHDLVVPQGIWE